ncbi:MAG: hypothetical protein U0136_18670 [Bdellovibrionota bacterium]
MDKDLDPLRELEPAAEKNDLPPTTEIRSRRAALQAEKPSGSSANASSGSLRRAQVDPAAGSPQTRMPTINHPQSGGMRNRYGNIPKVRITENIATQQQIRFGAGMGPILTLFVLGVIVAVLTIGIFSGTSESHGGAKSDVKPSVNLESTSFIEPLFGRFAEHKCEERCELRSGPAKLACTNGCKMYNLNVYGRRISFDKADPGADANEIANRCLKRDIHLEGNPSGSAWYEDVQNALHLVDEAPLTLKGGDFTKLRALYNKLLDANGKLRLPPGGTAQELELAHNLVRSTCMQANLVLSAIAMSMASQNVDQFSAKYFRQVSQGIEPKANEISTTTLSQAKTLKLF